jgi:hypothetical protein
MVQKELKVLRVHKVLQGHKVPHKGLKVRREEQVLKVL